MTQIFDQNIAANIQKTKYADVTPNVWKSKKGASVKADFLCGGVSERAEKNPQKSDFNLY